MRCSTCGSSEGFVINPAELAQRSEETVRKINAAQRAITAAAPRARRWSRGPLTVIWRR